MTATVPGRDGIVREIARLGLGGEAVLVHGPTGIGKSAVLREVALRLRAAGCPCAIVPRTRGLGDVTEALVSLDPAVRGLASRGSRSRFLRAAEDRRAVLILDHVVEATTSLKGFVRSLRRTRAGLVLAVDVDHPRDHAWARAQRLAFREIELPPLARRHMRRLLASRLAAAGRLLAPEDQTALLEIACGRPGWIDLLLDRLGDPGSWRGRHIDAPVLRLGVSLALATGRASGAATERPAGPAR